MIITSITGPLEIYSSSFAITHFNGEGQGADFTVWMKSPVPTKRACALWHLCEMTEDGHSKILNGPKLLFETFEKPVGDVFLGEKILFTSVSLKTLLYQFLVASPSFFST